MIKLFDNNSYSISMSIEERIPTMAMDRRLILYILYGNSGLVHPRYIFVYLHNACILFFIENLKTDIEEKR